jgi:hypothetical protein
VSKQSNWKPIAIGCAVAAFALVVLVCGVGFMALRIRGPVAHNPGGLPVAVQQLEDGWAKYSMEDCSLSIELPKPPQPAPLKANAFSPLITRSYARYEVKGPIWVVISEQIRTARLRNLDRYTTTLANGIQKEPQTTSFTVNQRDATFDGHKACIADVDYVYSGSPRFARFIVMGEGRETILIRGTYLKSSERAKAGWEKVEKSIHWSPQG